MEIGWRIKDLQGDEGVVIQLMSLEEVIIEESGDPMIGDEDIPYLKVQRSNGTTFFAPEASCKRL